MAVRPKRYESKGGRKIRAVKVTERNYDDLLPWILRNATNIVPGKSQATASVFPSGDITNQRLRLHLEGQGIRVARVGDYVAHVLEDDLSLTDGRILIIKEDVFENDDKYTEIAKV